MWYSDTRARAMDRREGACNSEGTNSNRISGEFSGRGELRGIPVQAALAGGLGVP
jgi:hypothetical protein